LSLIFGILYGDFAVSSKVAIKNAILATKILKIGRFLAMYKGAGE